MARNDKATAEEKVAGPYGAADLCQLDVFLGGQEPVGTKQDGGERQQVGKRGEHACSSRINRQGGVPGKTADVDRCMSSKNIVEAVERDRIRPLEIIRSVEGAMGEEGLENARVNQPPERSVSDLLQDCAKHE